MSIASMFNIPEGYITGQGREWPCIRRTHLYQGSFADIGLPMCRHGWNRDDGESFSIWRNNVGPKGICKTCMKRAEKSLPGVPARIAIERSERTSKGLFG